MIPTLNLDAQKDQKMVLNPLELELQTVVRAIGIKMRKLLNATCMIQTKHILSQSN